MGTWEQVLTCVQDPLTRSVLLWSLAVIEQDHYLTEEEQTRCRALTDRQAPPTDADLAPTSTDEQAEVVMALLQALLAYRKIKTTR